MDWEALPIVASFRNECYDLLNWSCSSPKTLWKINGS